MLENIKRELFSANPFRYAYHEEDANLLQEMGIAPENTQEMLVFLRDRNKSDSLESLLDKPFKPKPQLAPQATRFSDGTIPVFYSALELETAEGEVASWYVKYALNNASDERTAYYRRFTCNFQGDVKDLGPYSEAMPYLIQDKANGYPHCNRIGAAAVSEALDGLLTPSAQTPKGTCLPVFSREALSNPQGQGFVAFRFDPALRKISVLSG